MNTVIMKFLKNQFVMLAAMLLLPVSNVFGATRISESFNQPVGSVPDGWKIENKAIGAASGGFAEIVLLPEKANRNALLLARSPENAGNAAVYYFGSQGEVSEGVMQDFTATAIINHATLGQGSSSGFAIRAQEPEYGDFEGYYLGVGEFGLALFRNPENHISLPRREDHVVFEEVDIEAGVDYQLKAVVEGSKIRGSLWSVDANDRAEEELASVEIDDARQTSPGLFGLRTANGNSGPVGAYFRDLHIEAHQIPKEARTGESRFKMPASDSSGPLTLVKEGTPSTVLLIADFADDSVRAAADQLNHWVEKITGTRLEIVRYSEWDGTFPVLALGVSEFTQEAEGISKDSLKSELEPESAVVRIRNDYAVLAGRGNPLHPVIELVKHGFGVRWIMPGDVGEVYEPRETLELEPREWNWNTELPDSRMLRTTRFRTTDSVREEMEEQLGQAYVEEVWDTVWAPATEKVQGWAERQRVDVNRVRASHAYKHWWDEYGEDHPEWFAMNPDGEREGRGENSKLCVSNPEVAEQKVRENKDAIAAGRDLPIMPNDSRGYCVCDSCRAWDAPEMQELSDEEIHNSDRAILSDRYARFWNRIAEKATEINPDVRLTTYAYRSYEHPPLTDIELHPNIWVGVVTGEGFYPDEPLRDYWRGWSDAGASLFWRPNLFHAGHGMPYVYARRLGEDLKFFHEHNMVGANFDSITGHWGTQGINYYVAAEMLTRPEADVEEVLDEYYNAFGRAAPAVRKYFEYWHEVSAKGPHLLREHDLVSNHTWGGWWPAFVELAPILYTDEVFAAAEEHLDKAEKLAANDAEVVRERVNVLRQGFEHSQKTASAIADTMAAGDDDVNSLKKAVESQRELLEFRRKLFAENPYAVNIAYLMNKERRRSGMWREGLMELVEEQELLNMEFSSWYLRKDPDNIGRDEQWYKVEDPGQDWRETEVPEVYHNTWAGKYHGYAWYQVEFVPPANLEEDMKIRFAGIDEQAWVYINGEYIGEHTEESTDKPIGELWDRPFSLEVPHELIQPGKPNSLVVRVHNSRGSGGIHGPVFFYTAE